MARYVFSKSEEGEFTGFCTKDYYDAHAAVFLSPGESAVEFEGPDDDGRPETFKSVKQLAMAICKGHQVTTRCLNCDRTIATIAPLGKDKVRVECTKCHHVDEYEVTTPEGICQDCGDTAPVRFYWFRGELFRLCEECESNHRQLE